MTACPPTSRGADTHEPPPKHCLLIVDDEPDVCDSVQALLRREFRVLKANSAQEGFKSCRRRRSTSS